MTRKYIGDIATNSENARTAIVKAEERAQEKDKKISVKIKDSLNKQLEIKGAKSPHFCALVDDFVFYWLEERKAQRDIASRGASYNAKSSTGKEFEKDNPNIKAAVMYNKQKLAILEKLNMSPKDCEDENEDKL